MGMESINDISNLIIQGWGYAKNAVEFAIITVMIYFVLYFLRRTRAVSVLAGIIMILLFTTFLSLTLNLEVFGWLLENLWTVFSTAMIVIFQPELRRAFAQLGSHIGRHKKIEQKEAIEEIVSAVMQMSFRRCGALIIFERQIGMAAIINSAVALETKINSLLVQSIFYPNSPLHDGAVIVRQGIIAAAHAILPLSQDETGTRDFGTRHRAAIGVTEETDAVAVVVSEETGTISVAYRGRLIRNLSETDLLAFLKKMLIDPKQVSSIYEKFSDLDDQKTLALSSVDDEEDHDVIK